MSSTPPPTPISRNPTNSSSMAEQDFQQARPPCLLLLLRVMSKTKTWVCLLITVYPILLFFSWNLLKFLLSGGWPAIYASVLLGVGFGLMSMAAALAVAVPATVVTWISVLVLLTFFGKTRKSLMVEGRKLTAEITGTVVKILIKEGNVVAAVCAVFGYFALFRKNREDGFW